MAHTPNRALARATLETLAWQNTPTDYRGGSGLRRAVLVNAPDGTTLMPLSELTDNQLRKYIGPKALEEAGDMKKNGEHDTIGQVDEFIRVLESMLNLGDSQIFYRTGAYGRLFINFYNVPLPHRGSSAEGENNRLMLDLVGLESTVGKVRIELIVRGPAFGQDFKLRTKTTTRDKAAEYVAEFLNRAAKKAPYGMAFEKNSRGVYADITPSPGDYVILPQGDRYRVERVMSGGARARLADNGYPSFSLCRHAIDADRERRGDTSTDGFIFEVVDHELLEVEGEGHARNARREEADEHAARELSLFIENDYALVGAPNSRGKAIEKNLLAKIRNGSFDLGKSEQAWMYLMEEGAKKYAKEFASEREWSRLFNPATRELVAHEFAVTFYDEHQGALAKNGRVEDGDYFISGAYSDGTICESFSFDGEEEDAIREARKMLRSPTFEGDSVRVITRDGELVWRCRRT